mgnify:CR=1 FL=1
MRELFRKGLAKLSFRRQASRGKKISRALLSSSKFESTRIKDALKKETKKEVKKAVTAGKKEVGRIKANLAKRLSKK